MEFEKLDSENIKEYLEYITEQKYVFAVSAHRKWGHDNAEVEENWQPGFFQIMPLSTDDGFFKWYVNKRPNHQFFKTREMAVIHFLRYWFEWSRLEERS